MSISMKVTVEGKENINKVAKAGPLVRTVLQDELTNAMLQGYQLSYNLCPVRTGFLRSTIQWFVHQLRGYLQATAPYAIYVEMGTYRMRARPFLRSGLEYALTWFRERIQNLPKRVFG